MVGGYNSGGHNKTHGRVEEYSRIDSFSLLRYADWFDCLSDYGEYKHPVMGGWIFYNIVEETARMSHNGREYPVRLSRVPNVDGISCRLYFLCPKCGSRARHLYKKDGLYQCRKCAKLNYGIQQRSGPNLLRRKMYFLVVNKLQYVDWEVDHPDIPIQDLLYIPRPRYMRQEKYERLIQEYRRLQDEYERGFFKGLLQCRLIPDEMRARVQAHIDSI